MMSDAALVLRARGGDEAAFAELESRYRRLIRQKADPFFLPGGDLADLLQEGLLGLYKAIRDYRTDRESSFRNFAELCITRQIITAVKTATRNKHTPLNAARSMFEPIDRCGDSEAIVLADTMAFADPGLDAEGLMEQREEMERISAAAANLTPLERRAVMGIANGDSYEEISARTGDHWKAIDNAAQRARRKLRRGPVVREAAA